MSLLRKARRAAEKQKKSVEKARKKEAQKQENIYRKNRSFAGLFNSEEERDKCLEKLLHSSFLQTHNKLVFLVSHFSFHKFDKI